MRLHGYFRSSASWRVRIVLAVKNIDYEPVAHHLGRSQQRAPTYLALNPQGLVPALELGNGTVLTQSLAICQYLEDFAPQIALLPTNIEKRAHVLALAQIIACDIHPLQNLKILNRLRQLGQDDAGVNTWAAITITEGLEAFSALRHSHNAPSIFSYGDSLTLADAFLVPQLFNARRFGAQIPDALLEVEKNCLELSAFSDTHPLKQHDAE